MKSILSVLRSAMVMSLGAAFFLSADTASAQLPDGPGKQATQQICGNCHPVEVVMAHRQSRDEWINSIQKMIAAGAEGTEDQFTAILEYLTKNFGPKNATINVNMATAAELQGGLGLTDKESEAVVKYRAEKGAFKAVDDLKKVPDVDFKKIEAQKDRIVF